MKADRRPKPITMVSGKPLNTPLTWRISANGEVVSVKVGK
jgi:hypothetical protein